MTRVDPGAELARAKLYIDERGRLQVVARATVRVAGKTRKLRRRLIVPDQDEELAAEIIRQLNVQFAMGDLSWIQDGRPAARSASSADPTFEEWADRWLERCKPPVIGDRTWYNYWIHTKDLVQRLGSRMLSRIDRAAVMELRRDLERKELSSRSVGDRLAVLRMILRDAEVEGLIDLSPFRVPMPRRRTKREGVYAVRRVHFQPFTAKELTALLGVLRAPKNRHDTCYFPATEMMLLTGLRWGESVGVLWDDVSWVGERVHIQRAVVRGQDDPNEPTKTGAKWEIPLTVPLRELLQRQRARSFVGRVDGRVFPGIRGTVMTYGEWRKRGWIEAIRRAKVAPKEGDAQKALRRSFVTAALICGRNPKEVSEWIGHANTRMVTNVYDSFLGPDGWPQVEEIERLRTLYGWGSQPRRSKEESNGR